MPLHLKHVIFFLLCIVLGMSCMDLGVQLPKQQFTSDRTKISVVKGGVTQTIISGGIIPYSIKTQPNNSIATVSLSATALNITGVDTGSTLVIIQDSKLLAPDTVKIEIMVVGASPILFSGQIQPIFNSSCVSCHGTSGNLNLTSSVSYNQLVNVTATSSCTSMYRVLPYQANNSVLYQKIIGTSCGSRMPQGGSLTMSEINLIRDWINQGALQ